MAKSRKRFPAGEMTEDIVFWPGIPVMNVNESARIDAEIMAIQEILKYQISVAMGEVKIPNVPLSESAAVRQVMEGKKLVNGRYTMKEKV